MRRCSAHAARVAAVVALSVVAPACGGDDEEGMGGGEVRQGGAITVAPIAQPDFLDPALSYTIDALESLWLVYTPPVTYKRAEGKEGTTLIPGLAQEMPTISADGKTVSFRFRDGLRFSNGTPLKASDFEHTIKRVLNLESGGSGFYLVIEGAKQYAESRKPQGDISGIETDDETGKVTIRLIERDGTILNVLAMNFAGVVPGDTPFKTLSRTPPGIGPYRITESVPNREFVLERNRHFDIPDIPKGNLDRITAKVIPSRQRQANMVIRGELDYMVGAPPADLLPEIRTRYRDRYEEHVTVSTHYFFMNARVSPFDRRAVRQAVNYAIDSRALARLFAGRLEPTCNFLPSNIAGYEQIDPCPYGDPDEPGDVERAQQLIEEGGAEGKRVKVWTLTENLGLSVGAYLEDLLDKIGLDAELEAVDAGVFFQTVGNQRTGAAIGVANWFQDFPHPANFLFLVDGDSIQATNNPNFGNTDDPELNRLIDQVERLPAEEGAAQAADADRLLVEEAYVAPWGSERVSTFLSERMDFETCSRFHPVYANDYSSFCLK
jgi:peptide/nickel transport system substrate-binding protein